MKLHVGCGKRILQGYVNIDAAANAKQKPDIISDAKDIPLPDGCATEILAIHLFEHFYRWECDEVLTEWARLLQPGGTLIMEMPDFFKWCENVVLNRKGKHPDQMTMWAAYGDPTTKDPYMCHRWGWSFATIKPLLESHGFHNVREAPTQWHITGREHRDFRVTAQRIA